MIQTAPVPEIVMEALSTAIKPLQPETGAAYGCTPRRSSTQPLAQTGSTFTMQFAGGAQTTPVSMVFTTN